MDGEVTTLIIEDKDDGAGSGDTVYSISGTPTVTIDNSDGQVKLTGTMKVQSSTNGGAAADAAATNVVVTYSIYTWNSSTGSYNTNALAVLSDTQASIASGTAIDASNAADVSYTLATGTMCKVLVSIDCDELSAPAIYECYTTVVA